MRIAIMQPYFMPYIGYFQLINAVDKFVVYDDVNFIKKGWISRNNILVNGKSYLFSVPLQNMSQNKLINEIQIVQSDQWKSDFLKTIYSNYKKAPNFDVAFPIIEKVINYKQQNLTSYIVFSITELCKYLEIDTQVVISSDIPKNNELKGECKIIEICTEMHATNYINAIGGKELYSSVNFSEKNLKLQFIKSDRIEYKQFKNEFIPWLSIIDVIMFNSVKDTKDFLEKFELV